MIPGMYPRIVRRTCFPAIDESVTAAVDTVERDRGTHVDPEISVTSALEEYSERRLYRK